MNHMNAKHTGSQGQGQVEGQGQGQGQVQGKGQGQTGRVRRIRKSSSSYTVRCNLCQVTELFTIEEFILQIILQMLLLNEEGCLLEHVSRQHGAQGARIL